MINNKLRIIHIEDIPQGGFAGIVEKQMVVSPLLMANIIDRKDISHGIGDFVYLSTGYFKPNDGAPIHPHKNIDIVTVVLSGSIAHKGSLGDGTVIHALGVQVQRAGTGMRHSEVNPENNKANFIQLWFLPPEQGLKPDYQNIKVRKGELTTVLGGECTTCFNNKMTCKVGNISSNNTFECNRSFIMFIANGNATANGIEVSKGDLIEGELLQLKVTSELEVVLIY